MSDTIYLSKEKRESLEKELNELTTKGRAEMAKKIAEARSHGDLSENADYDAAKDAQGLMELKINKISKILANSQVIDTTEFPEGKAFILSFIDIRNTNTGDEFEYQLVSDAEADFLEDKLSVESPIGKALLGHEIGDKITVKLPNGEQEFEITNVYK